MNATLLTLNAYYNRAESLTFLREILRPLSVSWAERGLLDSLFFRRSCGRGEHFQIFVKLTDPSPERAALLPGELQRRINEKPSSQPELARSQVLYFKPFLNNSVRVSNQDWGDAFAGRDALKDPVEKLAAMCCARMLQHAGDLWDWPRVALVLGDAVFDGFGLESDTRIAALNSFLQMFVPASCTSGKSRQEGFEAVKLLLQRIRRDYAEHSFEYSRWIDPSMPRPVAEWADGITACCGAIAAVCVESYAEGSPALPSVALQTIGPVMTMVFLGLIDCLLLEESDALATAYRLQQIYRARLVSLGTEANHGKQATTSQEKPLAPRSQFA